VSDSPHQNAIDVLNQLDEENPTATLFLDEDGPGATINTGHTGDPTAAQFDLIATHILWMSDNTNANIEQIAMQAAQTARQLKDEDGNYRFQRKE